MIRGWTIFFEQIFRFSNQAPCAAPNIEQIAKFGQNSAGISAEPAIHFRGGPTVRQSHPFRQASHPFRQNSAFVGAPLLDPHTPGGQCLPAKENLCDAAAADKFICLRSQTAPKTAGDFALVTIKGNSFKGNTSQKSIILTAVRRIFRRQIRI